MKPKSVMVFGAITAVSVVAAVLAVLSQRPATSIKSNRQFAFPQLQGKINDVSQITVKSAKAEFTMKRMENGWGIVEKGGYLVSFEKVKSAIVGLSELKLLESKTGDPERYSRLDLRDPSNKDAKSKSVQLRGDNNDMLAEGIIGRENASLFGGSGGGTYLRQQKEKSSWLASGTVQIGPTPNDWLIRDIVNIDAENVKRVVIRQPDGAELVISKADRKQKNFAVENIPAGRKLKSENEGKEVAGGLWRLTLEDVKPAKGVKMPEKVHEATYTTFAGLTVTVKVVVDGEDYTGRFSASADGAVGDEKAKAKVAKQAKEINDRVTGWHYELSVGEGERLTTKMKDLLAEPAKS